MTGLRERNKERRRDAILDAALALLRTDSFDRITVEQIASDAQVSPQTVYNLVGPRDQLVQALLGRIVRQMAAPSPRSDADPFGRLRAVVDQAIDTFLSDPDAYRQVVRLGVALPVWPRAAQAPVRLVVDATQRIEDAGLFLPGVGSRFVARQVYAGFGGWVVTWANGMIDDDRFRIEAHAHVDLVLAATTRHPSMVVVSAP